MYYISQGLTPKASSRLVLTSVAFQDHITRNLLHPNFPLSDPFLRGQRKAPRKRVEERGQQTQNQQEEREHVLDSAPPPLTLGKINTLGIVEDSISCDLSKPVFFSPYSSSEVGFGGLSCGETDGGRVGSGQGEVCSAGGLGTALCHLQRGVLPSASGISPPTQMLLLIL